MKDNIVDLQIACKHNTDIPNLSTFQKWIKTIFIYFGIKHQVTIRLVNNNESCRLNLKYRGKDYPTNILSFPFERPPWIKSYLLGDLVICFPVITKEAIEQKKSIEFHLAHIVVHGILHLLGYSHNNINKANTMESIEIEIMSLIGYPNPYVY
ncbi:rRNA maturation RNase YbeY [Candidatus Pantoea edessiphila]|uniref:Endoribonuclease YbeY n=1 Tax=Candidatus Pantoea edessiphila TaxID=2044610 RepID=A0A2P5T0C9_9GAMM|nr:rRNA maturation RNase YbeY [Candidatus Pantoea edessiphila]PPI88048.1 rRNA maturation RNase YbeY [Candidatus Pantoea edessiphila]